MEKTNKPVSGLDRYFGVTAAGSTVKTELLAGLTTFFAMAYILMVNAGMLSATGAASYGAIYVATALSAVVGTMMMGLVARLPLAQASGMGLNAYFVYTVCFGLGLSYANALVLVLFDGLLFIVLTVTGLRKVIFESIPKTVRAAIPAGIGLFIAFIGLQNSGLVAKDSATGVALTSLNLTTNSWGTIMPLAVTLITLFAVAILAKKNVRGSVLIGMLGGSVLYYLLGFVTVKGFNPGISMSSPFAAFKDWGTQSFCKVFTEGFNFTPYIQAHGMASTVLMFVTTALAFCMVDMFDTMGTLYGACARGNMLTKDGEVPNVKKAMLADAVATATGAVCGTSTVTTFVESSAGVAEGGRTGLTAVTTAVLFFVAMFLSPIAQLIPGCATAAVLVYVGILMLACVKDIDWHDPSASLPAFLTMAMMPFTYSISNGIAIGLLGYIAINLFTGKAKEIKVGTWVITALFLAMLLLTH